MGKPARRVPRPSEFDPEYVRDISELVYIARLGKKNAASMIEKDGGDGGKKLRARAESYDQMTIAYLRAIKQVETERGN